MQQVNVGVNSVMYVVSETQIELKADVGIYPAHPISSELDPGKTRVLCFRHQAQKAPNGAFLWASDLPFLQGDTDGYANRHTGSYQGHVINCHAE